MALETGKERFHVFAVVLILGLVIFVSNVSAGTYLQNAWLDRNSSGGPCTGDGSDVARYLGCSEKFPLGDNDVETGPGYYFIGVYVTKGDVDVYLDGKYLTRIYSKAPGYYYMGNPVLLNPDSHTLYLRHVYGDYIKWPFTVNETEGTETGYCSDKIDNDYDGATDLKDEDCATEGEEGENIGQIWIDRYNNETSTTDTDNSFLANGTNNTVEVMGNFYIGVEINAPGYVYVYINGSWFYKYASKSNFTFLTYPYNFENKSYLIEVFYENLTGGDRETKNWTINVNNSGSEAGYCSDGADNDGDGAIDYEDSECTVVDGVNYLGNVWVSNITYVTRVNITYATKANYSANDSDVESGPGWYLIWAEILLNNTPTAVLLDGETFYKGLVNETSFYTSVFLTNGMHNITVFAGTNFTKWTINVSNATDSNDSDGDGLIDEEDKCPSDAGPKSNAGCPMEESDIDYDGIPDTEDKCPKERGPLSNRGCPLDETDSDNDGIPDEKDRCPEQWGALSTGGCPVDGDKDWDSIPDEKDRCPDQAGPLSTGGCPVNDDGDGDGIPDFDDKCPDQAGPLLNAGCPITKKNDTDFDGIPDDTDRCYNESGPLSNAGCPITKRNDTDFDGIPDGDDKCPWDYGPIENKGCPMDSDSDYDGIPDDEDYCPREAGPVFNKGCPLIISRLPDTDRDGVPDVNDTCTNVSGVAANDGCPVGDRTQNGTSDEPDYDGDGIPDKYDACPNTPGNYTNKGCLLEEEFKDSDYDGIPDEIDRCKYEYGSPFTAGCPLRDFHLTRDYDDDGVPDNTDNCPGVHNPAQTDTDGDFIGDECDKDITGGRLPLFKGNITWGDRNITYGDNVTFRDDTVIGNETTIGNRTEIDKSRLFNAFIGSDVNVTGSNVTDSEVNYTIVNVSAASVFLNSTGTLSSKPGKNGTIYKGKGGIWVNFTRIYKPTHIDDLINETNKTSLNLPPNSNATVEDDDGNFKVDVYSNDTLNATFEVASCGLNPEGEDLNDSVGDFPFLSIESPGANSSNMELTTICMKAPDDYNSSTLKLIIRYFNTSGKWENLTTYIIPSSIGYAETNRTYACANSTHFSVYGVSGIVISPPSTDGDDDGAPSGGGGGGGGASPKIYILANSIDLNLSANFTAYMKSKSIRIEYLNASNFTKYKKMRNIVILGGPDAPEGVDEIVREVLNETEQAEVRVEGSEKLYIRESVWTSGQRVFIIAGSDRWGTKEAGINNKETVKAKLR